MQYTFISCTNYTKPYTKHVKICQIVVQRMKVSQLLLTYNSSVSFRKKAKNRNIKTGFTVIFTLCVKFFFLAFNFWLFGKTLTGLFNTEPSKKGMTLVFTAIRLKVSRSQKKLSSGNFSQKLNGWICFSILTSRKYLKHEFWFQVSSISQSSG